MRKPLLTVETGKRSLVLHEDNGNEGRGDLDTYLCSGMWSGSR